jgi:hypothetical protein
VGAASTVTAWGAASTVTAVGRPAATVRATTVVPVPSGRTTVARGPTIVARGPTIVGPRGAERTAQASSGAPVTPAATSDDAGSAFGSGGGGAFASGGGGAFGGDAGGAFGADAVATSARRRIRVRGRAGMPVPRSKHVTRPRPTWRVAVTARASSGPTVDRVLSGPTVARDPIAASAVRRPVSAAARGSVSASRPR